MLVKKIKFENFNNKMCEMEAMFNLTKTEILRLEASKPAGLEAYTEQLVKMEDRAGLLALYEEIVQLSYGKVSADGNSFEKELSATRAFVASNAYDNLIIELLNEEDAFLNFVKAIVPKGSIDTEKVVAAIGTNA